jgi:hypothetical protein
MHPLLPINRVKESRVRQIIAWMRLNWVSPRMSAMSQIADAQHCLREGENTTIRDGSAQPMNVYFGGFAEVRRRPGFWTKHDAP